MTGCCNTDGRAGFLEQRTRQAAAIALSAVLVHTSCDMRQDDSTSALVRDSSGIRIVDNPPGSAAAHTWRAGPEPRLVVGDEVELPLDRITGVLMLGNDRLAISHMSHEILVVDAAGRLIRRTSGRGDGPGEFSQLVRLVRLPGDSIGGYNSFPPRISIFDRDGAHARDVTFSSPVFDPRPLRSGHWIGGHSHPLVFSETPSLITPPYLLIRYSADGTVEDTIVRMRGRSVFGTARAFSTAPFSPNAFFTTMGDEIVAAWSGEYSLQVHDAGGQILRIIRNAIPSREITPELRLETLDRIVAGRARAAAAEGSSIDWDPPIPDRAPAFDRMFTSSLRDVWVQRFELPSDTAREWHIFAPDGRMKARLLVPTELRIHDADSGRVAGVWTGDLGVQTVRVFELNH
jgi:hypothetical protein